MEGGGGKAAKLFDVVTRRSRFEHSEGFCQELSNADPVPTRPRAGFGAQLVVASINDLTQRHGFGPMAAPHPPNFQLFSLKDDPDGLWVAEEANEILGFAWSWVCGDLWFLAQLFVSPGHQGRSIGNELLKRTLEHAQKSNVTNRALITFTFNTVSQGLIFGTDYSRGLRSTISASRASS